MRPECEHKSGLWDLSIFSKELLGILNSFQKNQLHYYNTSGRLVFVCFLKEFGDTKKIFRN